MPPKRSNIGRLTKSAQRQRKVKQNEMEEKRDIRSKRDRLRMVQSRAKQHITCLSSQHDECFICEVMPRKRCLKGVRKPHYSRKMKLATNQTPDPKQHLTGHFLQNVANIDPVHTRDRETFYLSEEKQKFFDFSNNIINKDTQPVIKTEVMDPFEQSQELIVPDYPQHLITIDPMLVVETEILDSSETNQILLSNIKVEHTQIDNSVNKLSRYEKHSIGNINYEIDNVFVSKYKLTKCFVLLHDCLIPENLALISAKFKFLKINKNISEAFSKIQLFPLSDSPFFNHISEAYKKLAFSKGCEKVSLPRPHKKISYEKEKKPIIYSRVHSNTIKKKERLGHSRHICTCFRASERETITSGSELYGNCNELTQQLCECATSDFTMKPVEIHMKEISLFDPDFGKVSCGLNKIDYSF